MHICGIYMTNDEITATTELRLTGISGFFKRKVTPFGNGAKVDCQKRYIGKTVYLVVLED